MRDGCNNDNRIEEILEHIRNLNEKFEHLDSKVDTLHKELQQRNTRKFGQICDPPFMAVNTITIFLDSADKNLSYGRLFVWSLL